MAESNRAPLRIAVVTPLYPTAEQPCRGLPIFQSVKEMARCDGVQVQVFCPVAAYPPWLRDGLKVPDSSASGGFQPGGPLTHYFTYPAVPFISRPVNGVVSGRYMLPHLRAFAPDLILAYWVYPEGYGAVLAGERLGVPVVVGARGSDLRRIPNSIVRSLTGETLRRAAAVLTVSEDLRGIALGFGASPERTHTILNGCDPEIFHYRDPAEARPALNLPEDHKVILYVGRLVRAKGIDELYAAVRALAAQDPAIHLYCIGGAKAGDDGHIHQLGTKPPHEVAQWIAAADVFCLPSHTEGCPNVVIEAMSVGTPLVTTDVGGIPELVAPGNAIVIPPHRVDRLKDALRQALEREWDRKSLSRQFRRGWNTVAEETIAICGAAVQRAAAEPGCVPQLPAVRSRRTTPLNLIITADDWGRTAEVNSRVFDLLSAGKLTCASILANAPEAESALALARRFPRRGFGVHLNVTEFRPLTGHEGLRPLLDGNGELSPVIRRVKLTPALVEAVYQEWCAQIGRVVDAGIRVDHLDSHHHAHNLPQLLPTLRRIRKRYNIPRARVSMNLFGNDEHKARRLLVSKSAYNTALRHFCGFQTPDGCTNFSTFVTCDESKYARMSSVELMTHPGHPGFEPETRLLMGVWNIRTPYRLMCYEDL